MSVVTVTVTVTVPVVVTVQQYLLSLMVSGTNARYLVNGANEPVVLIGFHTWGNTQDGDTSYPPAAFDWDAYISALLAYGCNFTELWCHEMTQSWADVDGVYFTPNRYERNGPGNGYDGKPKYDVTSINQDYLDRLRARAVACRNNNIYVGVMLFDGWCVSSKGMAGSPWLYHPYELANNINSLDTDTNNDSQGDEAEYHTGNNALPYEEDLVEAILDTLNDLDNVIYNVCNEATMSDENNAWHEHMMDHIRTYEATKPYQHLVGFTKQYPGTDATACANVKNSSADFGAYGTTYADAVYDGNGPVSMYDTDHTVGLTSQYIWIWQALCNGHGGMWYMDEWDGVAYGNDTRNNATYILIRDNLGYANTLVGLLDDLLGMTPQAALCSSGYCLAKDQAANAEYICYYNGSGTFTLDLSNAVGTLNIRWLKCADGTVTDTDTTTGGAVRTLTPPWTGVVIAYVRHP